MKKFIYIAVILLLVLSLSSCGMNKETETDDPAALLEDYNVVAKIRYVDNGVLKKAVPKLMDVPVNLRFLGRSDITAENNAAKLMATVVSYELDGDVVNWATENNVIYVITADENRLVVIDAKTMSPLFNIPLDGVPAEVNIVGKEIYISLPDLCRVDVFSKIDCIKVFSLDFDHQISSFCFDEGVIYYSEHDQHCRVFRKDLVTNEAGVIQASPLPGGTLPETFYFPKILLDKEKRILYVGESGSSGCVLYYYDADSLILKNRFCELRGKWEYGHRNHTREMFHISDEIFWGCYRFSDTNAEDVKGYYDDVYKEGDLTFVTKDLVATYEGLFLADTYECVVDYSDAEFDFKYILISDDYYIFFRSGDANEHIIYGLNFSL